MWIDFFICLFLGMFGVHKFREKKIGMGILYLCTMGLFGIGWFIDCIRYLLAALRGEKLDNSNTPPRIIRKFQIYFTSGWNLANSY